jgi:exopolysaccharide biosynthesis polyprenyl glycosylphosphotransferase
MSVGLSYQSWVNSRPTSYGSRDRTLRLRARASTAMATIAAFDAAAIVIVAASVGVPLTRWWAWAAMGSTTLGLAMSGQYHPRITLSVARDAGPLVGWAWLPFAALALMKVQGVSTATLLTSAAVSTVSMLAVRCVLYSAVRALRARGWFAERTLIIGAGEVSTKLASALEEHPEYGLVPVGFLDQVDSTKHPLPLFGDVGMLGMVLSEERIDRVVVAYGVTREADMVDVLRTCEDAAVDIHVLPRLFELATAVSNRNVDEVWGYPLMRLRRSLVRRHARLVKRVFDASVALVALLLVAPVYATLALAVKLSSPGPVHFRQRRVGQRGMIVDVLKFRSMRVNTTSDTEWKPTSDEVTRIGRVMRVTGLDELPQLWNILRGDMSLVGPRPERPFFVEQFKAEIPRYNDRHRVPVGLTGLAQVHGLRGDTSIDERVRLDNHYIETWSLWRDVVIVAQTASAVARNMFNRTGEPSRAETAVLCMARVDEPHAIDSAFPGQANDREATPIG